MKTQLSFFALVVLICSPAMTSADIIAFEDFDGGAFNLNSTSNVFFYGAGGGAAGDVMGIVSNFSTGGAGMPFDMADDTVADVSGGGINAGDTLGLAGQNSSAFFGMNDMDGADAPGFTASTWSFDISSAVSLTSIQMDIGALGDFEAASNDGFVIEASIDGGAFQQIFAGIVDEDAFKDYRPFDNGFIFSDDDPLELFIDGVATGIYLDKSDPLSGLFDTYASTLFAGASGTTLDLRISWSGTPSGNEPMGFDNFTINGSVIPEPASSVLLGLFAMGWATRRRRS